MKRRLGLLGHGRELRAVGYDVHLMRDDQMMRGVHGDLDVINSGAPPPEKNIGRISSQFDNKCDVSTLKWFPGVVRPVVERSCQAAACAR